MYNRESILAKIESEVTDINERHALLGRLKERLAKLQQEEAEARAQAQAQGEGEAQAQGEAELARLTNKKSGDSGGSGESALQQQPLTSESQVNRSESDSLARDSGDSSDPPDNAKNFAAALDKLDPALRETASDLYEYLHYKSKFARLTSVQREAVVELLRHHTCEKVASILAEPPPIGMNLRTSKAGVVRFREDYMRCAMQNSKRPSQEAAAQQRLAIEESFKSANASDESFRQTTEAPLRKRLFEAVHDPASDYHEIRWLIKSLGMLRKEYAGISPARPGPDAFPPKTESSSTT
jgi:hypothetical protein